MPAFWVKPAAAGGNDANDGTGPLAAWATIQKAAQRTWLPGDRLLVAGAFPGIPDLVEFKGGGSAADPVSIGALDPTGRPLLSFAAARANAHKFVVCGVGFLVADLEVTQEVRGTTPADRLVVAQRSADGLSVPADVTFRRIAAHGSYETFKAGDGPRARFEGCESWDAEIGCGLIGFADDSSIEGCLFRDFDGDGIQAKAGVRSPRIVGNTVVGEAGSDVGITIGGSSGIADGSTYPWWRDEGYECSHGVAANNLVIAVSGLGAGIRLQGARNASALNNTIVRMDGYVGYMQAFDCRGSGGTGWAAGPPASADLTIAGNVVAGIDESLWCFAAVGGGNAYRDNTHWQVPYVTGPDAANGWVGTWAGSGNATADPRLRRLAGLADWRDADARPLPGSPVLGACPAPAPLGFGGEPIACGRDRLGTARGPGPWDRGAFDESARKRRRERRRRLWMGGVAAA